MVFQEDVIWEDKSVVQNMQIIGRIKGMNSQEMEARIKFINGLLGLDAH